MEQTQRRAWVMLPAVAAVVVLVAAACGDSNDGPSTVVTATSAATSTANVPGADERATLTGSLTLDGEPLETEFLGARVIRDGLATACQYAIPPITGGRYAIEIVSDTEVRGCGAPGAEVLLWTFAGDTYYFATEKAPWPGNDAEATFDATFSSSAPDGASTPVTEMKGHLFDREARELPGGTVIEAYAGEVLCGVTSLRYGDAVERFYTLIVAGPDAVPGCAEGATLTFTIDGAPAVETAVNDLGGGSAGRELDLTLR